MNTTTLPRLPAGADWAFVALQYHTLLLNRVYVICVGAKNIVGVVGNGVIAAPARETAEMYSPWHWVNPAKFQRYSQLHIDGREILREAKPNFAIPLADISAVRFSDAWKWGMGTVPYSGRIFIHANGKQREFMLLGQQNGDAVRTRLDEARKLY